MANSRGPMMWRRRTPPWATVN